MPEVRVLVESLGKTRVRIYCGGTKIADCVEPTVSGAMRAGAETARKAANEILEMVDGLGEQAALIELEGARNE